MCNLFINAFSPSHFRHFPSISRVLHTPWNAPNSHMNAHVLVYTPQCHNLFEKVILYKWKTKTKPASYRCLSKGPAHVGQNMISHNLQPSKWGPRLYWKWDSWMRTCLKWSLKLHWHAERWVFFVSYRILSYRFLHPSQAYLKLPTFHQSLLSRFSWACISFSCIFDSLES